MLRLMMAAHREVAVPPESRFIVDLWRGDAVVEVQPFLSELSRYRLFRTWKLPIEEVSALLDRPRATYAEVIDAAYEAYARRRGKVRWGDKTPRYIEHIPFLADLFPAARFIHLVRDGRSVALSYAGVPYGPKTAARAANLWAKRVRRGLAAREILSPDRYLQLRYEDLVAGAEGQERQARLMCEFLGLEYDPSMLDYSEVARSEILGKSRLRNPYIVRRPRGDARSWKTQMPARQV